MLIDALTIAGPNLFLPSPVLPQLLATSSANGVDFVVVAPGRPYNYALPPANDRLAAEAASSSNVACLGRIDPLQGADAVTEARRCLQDLACAGLFLHPGEEAFRVRTAIDVLRVAAEAGAPVVVVAGVYGLSEPLQILQLANSVPDATVIMTSGGQINISGLGIIDAWTALERNSNLYVMTNGEYRQDYLERLVRELDPRRVLFSSLSPYYDQGFEVARIRSVTMDAEARSLVEGVNAERLFGLSLEVASRLSLSRENDPVSPPKNHPPSGEPGPHRAGRTKEY